MRTPHLCGRVWVGFFCNCVGSSSRWSLWSKGCAVNNSPELFTASTPVRQRRIVHKSTGLAPALVLTSTNTCNFNLHEAHGRLYPPARACASTPLELHLVRAMHDTVQNGISQCRLIQPGMPCRHRQLAGNQHRAAAHPVIEQPQQIIAFMRSNGGNGKVIQNQQIELGQLAQPPPKTAVPCATCQSSNKRSVRT